MPLTTLLKVLLCLDARDYYRACGKRELAQAEQTNAEQLAAMHGVSLPDTSDRESRVTLFPR